MPACASGCHNNILWFVACRRVSLVVCSTVWLLPSAVHAAVQCSAGQLQCISATCPRRLRSVRWEYTPTHSHTHPHRSQQSGYHFPERPISSSSPALVLVLPLPLAPPLTTHHSPPRPDPDENLALATTTNKHYPPRRHARIGNNQRKRRGSARAQPTQRASEGGRDRGDGAAVGLVVE